MSVWGRWRRGSSCRHPRPRTGVVALLIGVVGFFVSTGSALGTQTLEVRIGQYGLGKVTSQPAGINCPATCSATFPDIGQVVLTAVPARGYRLDRWDPECRRTSDAPDVCHVTITDASGPSVTAHFSPAATLQVFAVGQGEVTVTAPAASLGETPPRTCKGRLGLVAPVDYGCTFDVLTGRSVTLTAIPDAATGTTFGAWSDERCPTGPVCTLVLDAGWQSVSALFSPQMLHVRLGSGSGLQMSGAGTVTSSPPGIRCEILEGGSQDCKALFPLFADLELLAAGAQPVRWSWGFGLEPDCDSVVVNTCHVTMDSGRFIGVGFGSPPPSRDAQPGAEIFVAFRVRRDGEGSGKVRSTPILDSPKDVDCGRRCTSFHEFGDRLSLVADPDPGSRFVRWRGACSSQPTCRLAVGPVTRVAAVFRENAVARQPDGRLPSHAIRPSDRPSTGQRSFVARLSRIVVRGRGRDRVVVLQLRVNAAAEVRTTLARNRRRVATQHWRIGAGSRVLRWRLPARVRSGRYRIRITVRKAGGPSKRFIRTVRLPR
jgi:hypothetical protein